MKNMNLILIILFFNMSCYKEVVDYSKVLKKINFKIDNNNALADKYNKISVIVQLPYELNTIDNNKVEFKIQDQDLKIVSENINIIQVDSNLVKVAKTDITSNKPTTIKVKATITINNVEISKDTLITFTRAFCQSININVSSLKVTPSTFDEITVTTKLLRDNGLVSIGTIADTKVIDTAGIKRGTWKNYTNRTDSNGIISNQFTMGTDNYNGKLKIISESFTDKNLIQTDSITINSKN